MSLEVHLLKGETQESLLRRFQKVVQVSGILREVRARRYFIPKSDAARLKSKMSAKRKQRKQNDMR